MMYNIVQASINQVIDYMKETECQEIIRSKQSYGEWVNEKTAYIEYI